MCTLIAEIKPVARKDYNCMACYWILEGGTFHYFTFAEKRLLVNVRRNKWKILKGQVYLRQFMDGEGTKYTFKAIPEMHELCVKYDIYPEC